MGTAGLLRGRVAVDPGGRPVMGTGYGPCPVAPRMMPVETARLGLRRGIGATVLPVVGWGRGSPWRAATALPGLFLLASRTVAVARSG